jgi:hypothetical protein
MIITEEKNKRVVRSHDFEEVNCTIDAEDMRYVASLLRNNYSNTRLAVVREISANALDANAEANSDKKIQIKLPTNMNPTFSVRDFGGGLSQEDIFGLYSKYGKSTKRDSNNYIGAFGIGKFAPLSYGENFTCVSYHGGKKISYNVFVDESDDTKIVKLNEELSNEPSGLSIEVAVADGDISEFREIVQKFFKFFGDNEMPEFIGVEDDFIEKEEKILSSNKDSWFVLKRENNYYSRHEAHILMGRVSYPLDRHSINVENFVKDDKKRHLVENLLSMDGFYLRVPLGSVRLHHSRESLEYNKTTQKKIVADLLFAVDEIQEIAKEKLADSNDLWEAKRNYAQIVNAMPHNMRNIFENSFEWNGIKIDSPDFNRNYKFQDDLIVTHSWQEKDETSRNGFKIRSQKANRAICQDNYLFLVQDLESSHGNNLRVRTLMNEDDTLEGVYVIHPKSVSAQSEVDNEWQLGLVDKKHIRYTSNIEKEKPQRSGVRKSNGSRANIPLFVMTDQRHCHKNSQYWENASDDIQSVESDASDIEGSWQGKLIYVPIKNYKIDMDEFEDLSNMKNRLERIRSRAKDDSEEKKLKLFGVRAGDVKKLDKSVWINFLDFYKSHAREFVLENLEDSINCNASFQITHSEDYSKLSDYRNNLGSIFENNQFKPQLDGTHDIIVAKNLWNNVFDRSWDVRELVTFLRMKDADWIEENLEEVISAKDFIKLLDSIKEKYEMLFFYGSEVGSWTSIGENGGMKAISEYISLCDKCGDEG